MRRKNIRDILSQLKFENYGMEAEMQLCYESILFLGTSLFHDLKKFNLELMGQYHLCMEYFMEKGDYAKVYEIIELLGIMDNERKVTIDMKVLDAMEINLN
jgi:hypothetical protein